MPLRKGTPGTGLQVALEARRRRSVGKLHGDENPPGTMKSSLPRGTFIVPAKSLVYVRGTTDVVPRRIALTPEDVDEALTDAFHAGSAGILRASENGANSVKQSRTET